MGIQTPKPDSKDGKLTAHDCAADTVDRLKAYADARGISRAAAAKRIFEDELENRWLARAMGLTQWSRLRSRR